MDFIKISKDFYIPLFKNQNIITAQETNLYEYTCSVTMSDYGWTCPSSYDQYPTPSTGINILNITLVSETDSINNINIGSEGNNLVILNAATYTVNLSITSLSIVNDHYCYVYVNNNMPTQTSYSDYYQTYTTLSNYNFNSNDLITFVFKGWWPCSIPVINGTVTFN
jgi:hypothetical protein